MRRVPVHVVTGARRSGKSALIARLLTARATWLGIANALPDAAPHGLRPAPAGCPCCTARLALELSLVRALREMRPARVLIELADSAHDAGLQRVLAAGALARYVETGRRLVLPADASLRPEMLEAERV